MKAIVAVDNHWAIGNKGELLVSIPNDQKAFRKETTGKVVVLGRKTLATFPSGLPLKNRINIILSRDKNYKVKDAVVVHSKEELFEEIKQYDTDDIYIIGGESVYRDFVPFCSEAQVTKIDHTFEADSFFPNLDEDPTWELVADSEENTYFDLEYRFLKYRRKQ